MSYENSSRKNYGNAVCPKSLLWVLQTRGKELAVLHGEALFKVGN